MNYKIYDYPDAANCAQMIPMFTRQSTALSVWRYESKQNYEKHLGVGVAKGASSPL